MKNKTITGEADANKIVSATEGAFGPTIDFRWLFGSGFVDIWDVCAVVAKINFLNSDWFTVGRWKRVELTTISGRLYLIQCPALSAEDFARIDKVDKPLFNTWGSFIWVEHVSHKTRIYSSPVNETRSLSKLHNASEISKHSSINCKSLPPSASFN